MVHKLIQKAMTCAFIATASISAHASDLANWDNNKAHKTQQAKHVKISYRSGQITLGMNENNKDPYVAVNGFNRKVTNINLVKVRIKNNSKNDQTAFRLMFAVNGNYKGNGVTFTVPDDNKWRIQTIDFSKLKNWNRKISGIRIDGPEYSNGSFSVDYIRIVRKDGSKASTSKSGSSKANAKSKSASASASATTSKSGKSQSSASVKKTPAKTKNRNGFTHPGLFHTASEISDIKKNLKKEPYKSAFKQMKSSKEASLNYIAKPFAKVECGSYNKPNIGCSDINNDARAAYTHALMFALTNNAKHASKAKSILKAWANKYEKNTKSNANLVVSWAAPHFVNAGELLRHYDSKWSKTDQNKFNGMVKKFLPYLTKDNALVNNWIHTRIQAHMAIAIYLDDKKEFDAAVKRWKKWTPTYVYLTSDGKQPKMNDGHNVKSKWKETKTFVNGASMETCRDLHHMGDLGFTGIIYAGQYAWNQGVDLFKAQKKRLATTLEVHGAWMTGDKSVPKNMCKSGKVLSRLNDKKGVSKTNTVNMVWEVAYNQLSERLGEDLPYTREMILDARNDGGQGSERWALGWETLGHAK